MAAARAPSLSALCTLRSPRFRTITPAGIGRTMQTIESHRPVSARTRRIGDESSARIVVAPDARTLGAAR